MPLKDKLFRLALRVTLQRAEAEDIVQEALIKVWNNRDRWAEIESMEASGLPGIWRWTISRGKAQTTIRSARKSKNAQTNHPIPTSK